MSPRTQMPTPCRLADFALLRQVGLSRACMQRLERYRRRHAKQGAGILVLFWPDGTWCVLAIHAGALGMVVLDDGRKSELYQDARMMIRTSYLPLLALRFAPQATH